MRMQLPNKGMHLGALAILLAAVTGCGHHVKMSLPPDEGLPPERNEAYAPQESSPESSRPGRIPVTPLPPGGISDEDLSFIAKHKPIRSEEGYATWYTAPYKGRKAANGQVFDDRSMTAAHRTLPMGSLIKVTNMETGQTAAMRISDRGPFIEGRSLDMTIASAKATGVYRAGLQRVRIDVYRTPKPIDTGGRWCVQIGAFTAESRAVRLKKQLLSHYPGANVIEFPGENSYWVRIRPEGDDRKEAETIARKLKPEEGTAFLTRLD
ncbi:septal ring lytic transglycosylase RlpA family protein [Telmatobacter bradus]|uniref:septal ring lytic transglycosylase RlpA family protein n=1 Tax=Telmatobacter bradus TaxID=474953 RepID=UPI003B43BF4A